jgi:hypothetical protein
MSDFDYNEWRQNVAATENLEGLGKCDLKKYLKYFTNIKVCMEVTTDQFKRNDCKDRIEWLRREIDQRRVIKPAWIGAIAGIIAVIVGIILLVQDCSRSPSTTRDVRSTPMATPQPTATEANSNQPP